jgi:hypothetical protein
MIKWFNSDMSAEFHISKSMKLKEGETGGFCCTNSFGMVCLLPKWYSLVLKIRAGDWFTRQSL